MSLKFIFLLSLLAIKNIHSDDYFLEEDEEKEVEQSNNGQQDFTFMKEFSCLIATNQFLTRQQTVINKFNHVSSFGLNLKRLRANLFRQCMFEITEDKIAEVSQSKVSSDFEKINFHFLEDISADQILSQENTKITDEEKLFYKQLLGIEEKIKEMQKKQTRENPEAEENETWESATGQKQDTGIFFMSLDNKLLLWIVAFAFLILFYILYRFWMQLFGKESISRKKESKKLKQKFVGSEKQTQAPIPKTLFKPKVGRIQLRK